MLKIRYYFILLSLILLQACAENPMADMVIINAAIATMDEQLPEAEALAVKDGKILKIGTQADIESLIGDKTKIIDAAGKFVMPGFIEGHAHFSSLGKSLTKLNLMKSQNWAEIVELVQAKAATAKAGEWIEGRGWHQEKWNQVVENNVEGYPFHDALSAISPDNPVILHHASGHSLFANEKAMELAGISIETPNPKGGRIVRGANGRATGVFEETAMDPIEAVYQTHLNSLSQEDLTAEWYEQIKLAEAECLRRGITSFQDAGASYQEIDRYVELAKSGELDVRLWVMISSKEDLNSKNLKRFPIINEGNNFFTCRAIKGYADGALGSYGAWLLKPYNDKRGFHGQNVTPLKDLEKASNQAAKHGLQMCIHAIGDRANREILDIYEEIFKANPKLENLRWRIEHAQHINGKDIPRFAQLGVLPSMQGIHCTSDAPYVPKRLGELRAKMEAYAWRKLIESGATIVNGTDAPVEDVDPLPSFFASVTRQLTNSDAVFFPEQSMTRTEALQSYTINNAYGAFEEDIKGSLSVGKLADIVILSGDLRTIDKADILNVSVDCTIVGGKVKFKQK